jgi:hypothetical protein
MLWLVGGCVVGSFSFRRCPGIWHLTRHRGSNSRARKRKTGRGFSPSAPAWQEETRKFWKNSENRPARARDFRKRTWLIPAGLGAGLRIGRLLADRGVRVETTIARPVPVA